MNITNLVLKHKRDKVFYCLEILTNTRGEKFHSVQTGDKWGIDYYSDKERTDKENLEKARKEYSEWLSK